MYNSTFSALEMEFYATTSGQVNILPSYNDSEIYLMGRTVGPFRANHQQVVPFWLAIFLKQQQKCKILVPMWLRQQQILDFIERENNSPDDPIYLHDDNFFQLAYSLLNRAPESFEKARQIRGLVESLQMIRFQKVRKIIENTSGGRRLKYVTSYEINKWREGLSGLQKMVDRLTKNQEK